MAEIKIPTSNEDLLFLLRTALHTLAQDDTANLARVDAAWRTEATALLPSFEAKVTNLTKAQNARSAEVEERVAAIAELQMYVEDALVITKRRQRRLNYPASYFRLFDLPLDGTLPRLNSQNDVLLWAGKLVQGDADAVTAGYAPMGEPTAVELAGKLTIAQTEMEDVQPAERALDNAEDAIEADRAQAHALAQDLAEQLNFAFRKLAPSDRRRAIRQYGFGYTFAPGEPPDPEEGVTAVAPLEG